jgi:Outer membrane protein beta-barrel domain
MRLALALIFTAHAIYAQAATVGVIGAVPLTDTFDTGFIHEGNFDPKTVRYQVGPTIDFRLPSSFRVEINALYQPFSFNKSTFSGIPSQSHISGNLWQFPVLLKFRVPTPLFKPFIEAGPSIQIATNITEISTTLTQPTPFVSHPNPPGAVGGIALGGGIDLRLGHFLISPQVRYTRWISKNFDQGPGVGSHLNAIQVLLSIRR